MSEETEAVPVGGMDVAMMHSEVWWVRLMDEALTPEEQQAWAAHIVRCAACREEWEMLKAVDACLAAAPPLPELSPDFAATTAQLILQRQRLRKVLSAIVGTVIVVGITALVFSYLGAAYEALEWAISAVVSARQMLFRSLMQTLVGLILSWRAALPFIAGLTALVYLMMMPNGLLVTVALVWLSRRQRGDIGFEMEVGHA